MAETRHSFPIVLPAKRWLSVGTLLLASSLMLAPAPSLAASDHLTGVVTGLPLPRFVSLKSTKVNARVGPSRTHGVAWVYQRKGLPVEIIAEFEHWRRVRDADGEAGWIYHTLLDGDRTVILRARIRDDTIPLHLSPDTRTEILAAAETGVIAELKACTIAWCQLEVGGYSGWTEKANLWGVYPDEVFE